MRWKCAATAKYYLTHQKSLILLILTFGLLWWFQASGWSTRFTPLADFHHVDTVWATLPENYPRESSRPLPAASPKSIPRIQAHFKSRSAQDQAKQQYRLATVERAFKHAWSGYRERAWLYDELMPISGGSINTLNGWGVTLVDALDTLWIMGLQTDFEEAVQVVAGIDFDTPVTRFTELNLFETNIRYLGGLLGAYDISGGKYPMLLRKAVQLGHLLYHAFDTPNHMPVCHWNPQSSLDGNAQVAPSMALLADISSLSLEFTRLSQLTGDSKWYNAIAHVTDLLQSQQNSTKIPGLWPTYVNAKTGDFKSESFFSVGGQADSAYEYLPKMHLLLGASEQYAFTYRSFSRALKDNLLFQPMLPKEQSTPLLFPGTVYATQADASIDVKPASAQLILDHKADHVSCFLAGTLALAGRALSTSSSREADRHNDTEVARRLAAGCIWAYHTMPNGIMPEVLTTVPCSSQACPWVESRWYSAVECPDKQYDEDPVGARNCITKAHLPPGVSVIDDPRYLLRPEAIESVFVMYRTTGNTQYQEDAWRMFESIIDVTEVEFGHASLTDCVSLFGLPVLANR